MFGLFGASRELRMLERFLREHCADLDTPVSRNTPVQRAMVIISKLRARNDALQRQYDGARDLRGPFKVPDIVRQKPHKN